MRIPAGGSKPVIQNESTPLTRTSAKSKFDPGIGKASPSQTKKDMVASDIMHDVRALAQEVKAGAISKSEASKRFVSIVIEKRHDLSFMGPKGKQIEKAVKEIAGDDPRFTASLSQQLNKIAMS